MENNLTTEEITKIKNNMFNALKRCIDKIGLIKQDAKSLSTCVTSKTDGSLQMRYTDLSNCCEVAIQALSKYQKKLDTSLAAYLKEVQTTNNEIHRTNLEAIDQFRETADAITKIMNTFK